MAKIKMKRFRLHEISAVDTPAEQAALITLMKRANPDLDFEADLDPEQQERVEKHMADFAVALDAAMDQSQAIEKRQKETPTMKATEREEDGRIDLIERYCVTKSSDGYVSEAQVAELTGKLGEACRRAFGYTPQGGMRKAREMLADPVLFNELSPRVVPHLENQLHKHVTTAVNAKAAELRKGNEKLSRTQALSAARKSHAAPDDFMAKVNEIKKRDGIAKSKAMQKARHEDPEGFEAYQAN